MDVSGVRLRTVRAAVFTALVVTLSAASHVLLSRAPLPWTAVAGVSALVFAVAWALAGRERGYWRIAGLLIPLELAADTIFTSGQELCYGPGGGPVTGALRSLGFDSLCGGAAGARLPGVGTAGQGAAGLLGSSHPALPWLLLAAHIGVGLLASAWLWHGEAALAGLLRALGALAFGPLLLAFALVIGVFRAPSGLSRAAAARIVRRARLLVHSVGRRGPPVPLCG
ncbi:hypothetical protein I3J09_22025 [Streptomyces clavuligerus]|nr:hypothetical protein [Streptomyces clavuligerus]ANW20644.1 hypothetical protein BB341_21730 [Streptomyces clavuligerus]AXU15269.1 hypothetical protein D1794_22600 [Streptomyces clavuligerus]MBY6305347.1 hypothetical protein [Streptomyces clavuligerus]QCS08045.1 hypothetical protein CRV15_21965 [Streptomyces clavuligerus]QPJ92619.1 hypothetical protein GE265_06135 [Streptomyces clavuligerus]